MSSTSKGAFYERELLDLEFGNTAFSVSPPGTWYVALFTTLPAADGSGGVEVSGNNYSRASITNTVPHFPAASGSDPATKSNAAVITFPTPSGSWGLVVGAGTYDAATSGNLWRRGPLTTATSVPTGASVTIEIGALVVTET